LRKLVIDVGGIKIEVEVLDTPTGNAIWQALPMQSTAMTWGDEVYFSCPVSVVSEPDARAVVEAGEIAYWPEGEAIAIGFGETPISAPGEIRLASPCNIWGRALTDVTVLKPAQPGDAIEITKV